MEKDNGENPPNNVQPTFSCDQCGKEFPSKAALRGHRISHFRRPRADVAPPPPPPPHPLEQEEPRQRRVLALHCPGPNPPPPAKGKRGRGPTKPVVSSAEAHAVSDANLNKIFDMLTQLIMPFVSGGGNDSGDPSSSSKRLRPDYHLAQGLNYDEATDTVSFQRRALLIHQGGDPSNAFVDRGADVNIGKEGREGKEEGEGERRGGEDEEEEEEDGGGGVDDSVGEGERREEEDGGGVDDSGGEGERRGGEGEEEDGGGVGDSGGNNGGGGGDKGVRGGAGGSDDDGAGPSGEGSRMLLPDLNDPLPDLNDPLPDLNKPLPEKDD